MSHLAKEFPDVSFFKTPITKGPAGNMAKFTPDNQSLEKRSDYARYNFQFCKDTGVRFGGSSFPGAAISFHDRGGGELRDFVQYLLVHFEGDCARERSDRVRRFLHLY